MLTIMVLVLLLVGIQVLGDGTASCFMQVSTPPAGNDSDVLHSSGPPELDVSP